VLVCLDHRSLMVDDVGVVRIGIWSNRRFEFYNICWVALQTFGPCIRTQVDADQDAGLLGCVLWSVAAELVEDLGAIDSMLGRLFGVVHDSGQNIGRACGVLL